MSSRHALRARGVRKKEGNTLAATHLPTPDLQCPAWPGETQTGRTPVLPCPVLAAGLGPTLKELTVWLGRLDTGIPAGFVRTDSLCLSIKSWVAQKLCQVK